jgi:hypothetical protein
MAEFNYTLLIHQIDVFLAELGTSGIVDGEKARNQLIDLRILCMSMEAESLVPIHK